MIPIYNSIAPIEKVAGTNGSWPIIILAENIEYYICKYDSVSKLINEYLAHQFLQIWGIPVFEAAFVQIRQEHILDKFIEGRLQKWMFNKPTFGLLYNENAPDVTMVLPELRGDYNEINKFVNRKDLLKIALFDLWVAHNDRNINHYNMLIRPTDNGFEFVPIDHSEIFDGSNLGGKISQLTEEDSILSSELLKTFVFRKRNAQEISLEIVNNFSNFVNNCNDKLPEIVAGIPDEWCKDKTSILNSVRDLIVENQSWLDETIKNFKELVEINSV